MNTKERILQIVAVALLAYTLWSFASVQLELKRADARSAELDAQLARAPKQIAEQGCGYVLEVDGPDGADALTLFLSSGVRFRRVFRQFDNGFVEEAGHDLF